MVYIVVGEDGKVKKFTILEKAVRYMERNKGNWFFIEIFGKSIGISIIESENGEAIKKKEGIV